jgi:hypothetical protein
MSCFLRNFRSGHGKGARHPNLMELIGDDGHKIVEAVTEVRKTNFPVTVLLSCNKKFTILPKRSVKYSD